ncbi:MULTISPECIES: hypothetical protein [Streptomyces]|uniref:hypothetical protein n=1 Tax=Streptomyces TaxID=1883 RepID=UPI00031EF000|nr:hypothetical protein [Streptomyces venezuelae]APE25346.1 hypothetical protein vnz_32840 [Streptomyces venezuelae]QES02686.1 hypothetical protein DEJ43_33380 [Streptomyces venezuelae ATCC 10712]
MGALLVLLAVLVGVGALLVVTLLRRGRGGTDTAEGLLLEQRARDQAHHDRVSFSSSAVHNSVPTASDAYNRRSGRP